ncbi:MAG: twin-arginine translocase TatA/TatE family subunit [Planctomycetota bacterium]
MELPSSALLAFGMPGPFELTIIMVIALLLFGRRLPDVMRSVGKSVVEFKKGIRGIEDEVDEAASSSQKDITSPPSNPSS